MLGFADDLDIIGRSFAPMRNAFLDLEKTATRLGLSINQTKTKNMKAGVRGETRADTDRGVYF